MVAQSTPTVSPPTSTSRPIPVPSNTQSQTLARLRTEVDAAAPAAWGDWIATLRADGRAGAQALAEKLERRVERRRAWQARRRELWRHEAALHARGYARVAGVDEAGRGPLAGPIVAAAVVWTEPPDLPTLNDSKLLTHEQREALVPQILAAAGDWGIGVVDAPAIDRLNIQQANYLAMRLALADLDAPPDAALVDGFRLPDLPLPSERVVKGDQRSWSIAAASILAKVTRDHLMTQYHTRYPAYGFAAHKGYGTADHLDALRRHGPCPIHRHSFAPVNAGAQESR